MGTLLHRRGCWLILMKGTWYTKGHIYSHTCSVNQTTRDEPPSISLYPTHGATLFSYWVLTMFTAAPVAAYLFFGWWPSLMMVLAHRPGRNWQAKLVGICWGSAGPWLWRGRLPAAIYYWTQVVSFSQHLLSHPRSLFYRLSAGLIRADMLNVLGWPDVAITGACVCVCSLAAYNERCVLYILVKGYAKLFVWL